ncbi:hypothetical protein I4U23_024733 [Adineta vaga]|nr:hypothetical protein I4U23_024733 [Adineta vaga]
MSKVSLWWLLIVVFENICIIKTDWITGNLCWSMPCMNGGSCFGSTYTYLCVCPVNYSGALCEKRIGLCQENSCGNNGLCIETSLTSFECQCYFGYTGPTCAELIPRNQSQLWSSLLPVHTRVLFDILQESYNAQRKEKSSSEIDNNQIDISGLMTTNQLNFDNSLSTIEQEDTFTTVQSETTETEFILKAEEIELKKIFSDITTIPTVDVSTDQVIESSDHITSDIVTTENMSTTSMHQFEHTFAMTTEDQETTDRTEQTSESIISTSNPSSTDTVTIATQNSIEETMNNFENNVLTTAEITEAISDNLMTTTSAETIQTSRSPTANKRILYKLCRRILAHIFPHTPTMADVETALSLPSDSSLANSSNTTDTFRSWLQKRLNISTNHIQTSTKTSVSFNNIQQRLIPLQRIDIDDVLHQMSNSHRDSEH